MKDNLIFKSGNKNDVKRDASEEKEEKISLALLGETKDEKR